MQVGTASALRAVLSHLPPVQHAFAYGSGVLHQPGLYMPERSKPAIQLDGNCEQTNPQPTSPSSSTPMIDYILSVDDPLKWHMLNIQKNPEHYSWVAKLGPGAITGIADHVGVGIHFNTLVRMQGGQMIKYGVTRTSLLLDDLHTWRHLYVAGRLQKPVLTLASCVKEVEAAQAANQRAAAAAALLLLPPIFTTKDFLTKIVTLSYSGDVRMGIAEDPRKVERIVQGSRPALDDMYLPLISEPHGPFQPGIRGAELGGGDRHSIPGAPSDIDRHSSGEQNIIGDGGLGISMHSIPVQNTANSQDLKIISGVHVEREGVQGQDSSPPERRDLANAQWAQRADAHTQGELLKCLPPALLTRVAYKLGFQVPESHLQQNQSGVLIHDTLDDITNAAVRSGQVQQLVAQALAETVRASSASQALSGLLAAGGGKAVQYFGSKVAKAVRGAFQGAWASGLTIKRPP
ncbi:mitochondrial matrix Mmp37 [Dunaliella salina]|uniref:Phosphatidate cytidylyltransferase, mitochondrial n=1 Tax=Dunaliella salina TaxID=3046 RepID=A0ABQ7FZY7_DUNSA|nr:mitochondrial matrix Mmp37 [Dunaliella salina]|eukprot:KAF5827914.1 mitochondrial matrix Mmp37 [Dunaliella salina]